VRSYGAQIVGGITSPVYQGLGKAIETGGNAVANAVGTSLPRYLNYLLQGAGIGATVGGANAQAPDMGLPSAQDIIDSARRGGEWGGALGAAIPGALELGGRAATKFLPPSLFDKYTDPTGETGALRYLQNKFTADQNTPDTVLGRVPPNVGMLADTGPNAQAAAGAVAQRPGAGMAQAVDALTGRNVDASTRIGAGIESNVADPAYFDAIQQLKESRSAAAQPLRAAALEAADAAAPVKSETIGRMLERPTVRSGILHGIDLINDEVARTGQGIPIDKTWFEGTDLNNADVKIAREPTLRVLDAAKQGLGAALEKFRDPITHQINWTPDAVNASENLNTFTNEMRRLYPKYGEYLDAWSGPSKMMDAIGQGRMLAQKNDPQLTEKILKTLSPEQQQYIRIGAAKYYADAVGKTPFGGNPAGRVANSPNSQGVMEQIINDPAKMKNMETLLGQERTMNQTMNKALGGSATNARVQASADLEGQPLEVAPTAISALKGHFGDAALQMLHSLMDKITGPSQAVNDQLGTMLFSQDPAVQAQIVEKIRALPTADQARMARYIQSLGRSPASVGGLVSASTIGGSNQ